MIISKPGFDCLSPYVAGKPLKEVQRQYGLTDVIKLASNENPLGMSRLAKQAMAEAIETCHLYPDGGCTDLRAALSERLHVSSDRLVFGTGSDGLIELIGKAFLAPGDRAVMADKTFSLYYTNTVANGAEPVVVPLSGSFVFDTVRMAEAAKQGAKVLWLCNPNNPTGTIYRAVQQKTLLDAVPDDVLVVIDEAYYEYACGDAEYPNSLAEAMNRDNVIVLRTFSKIYGLAGLRVGYGIASPAVVREMEKVRAPFNVNQMAQAAAVASLQDDGFVADSLALNREGEAYLRKELAERGMRVLPSYTNFLMIDTGMDSVMLFEALLKRGVIVKAGAPWNMPTFLRVTIGSIEQCSRFIAALDDIMSR